MTASAPSLAWKEIARDGCTFCHLDEGRVACYSTSDKELTVTLPRGWDVAKIAAMALSTEKSQAVETKAENGQVRLMVSAQRPVMVYRDGQKAKKRLLPSAA